MAENIYMFGGESIRVKFRAKRYIMRDVLDWFGNDVRFKNGDEENVIADVKVSEQAMRYWALQYGEHIEVLEPAGLREQVGKAARTIAEKYV